MLAALGYYCAPVFPHSAKEHRKVQSKSPVITKRSDAKRGRSRQIPVLDKPGLSGNRYDSRSPSRTFPDPISSLHPDRPPPYQDYDWIGNILRSTWRVSRRTSHRRVVAHSRLSLYDSAITARSQKGDLTLHLVIAFYFRCMDCSK